MKFTSKLSAALVSMGLLIAASADDAVKFNVPGVSAGAQQPAASAAPATASAATAAAAAPSKPKFTETQIAEAYGWYTGMRMGLNQLGFTKAEVEAMSRGLQGAASGAQPSFDPKEIGPELEAFMAKKNEAFMGKLHSENIALGTAFFEKLKENKNVVELPSGLRYEVTKPGTGATPKVGQQVTINYTGTLANGQVFDSSIERGQPAEMILAPNQLIAGMVEGLQKVSVGGKIKLYIPAALAYGDEGNQGIPPAATLVFDVELLGVKDAPKDAAAPAPAPAPAK
jgi:FKBP-type peptidyl-prolyl cis-trans isomerase